MLDSRDGDALTANAIAAFRQASLKVIERARQTNTLLVVWKHGRVAEISPDEAEEMLNASEPSQE